MAIVLVEKGKAEVITAPVIREEIGGGRVQISGRMTTREANDVALLMRAGALAAPMEIVEERTVGPSLGKENIEKGFNSVHVRLHRARGLHLRLLPADGRSSRRSRSRSTCCCWSRCCRCCRPR